MRPQLDPLDPGRDAAAVARVLATDALCAECIARRTGVDVDSVLEAVAALEAQVRVHRTWGRCPACAGTGRTVLRLDEGSGARPRVPVAFDADPRHSGLRCGKCWKPIGVGSQRVVLRHGQPYHTACLEGPSRVRESSSELRTVPLIPGAESALVCTCSHARDRHQYEKARREWTVCRACRCVRFTAGTTRGAS